MARYQVTPLVVPVLDRDTGKYFYAVHPIVQHAKLAPPWGPEKVLHAVTQLAKEEVQLTRLPERLQTIERECGDLSPCARQIIDIALGAKFAEPPHKVLAAYCDLYGRFGQVMIAADFARMERHVGILRRPGEAIEDLLMRRTTNPEKTKVI